MYEVSTYLGCKCIKLQSKLAGNQSELNIFIPIC